MDSSTLWEFLNLEGAEILNHYSYDAFGNIIQKMEKVENRFCYNGEMLDLVTQQYYLRARFYNPVIGRFTQEDTYYGDGLNLYQYCQANPVGYVDPSGHTCEIVQNHYKQYQEYRKQHPKATAAEAYEAVTGKDPLKKDAGKSGSSSNVYIPMDADGNPIPLRKQNINGQDIPLPDPNASGPHTVLGGTVSSKTGEIYRQSATFPDGTWPTANGQNVPWSEVHWTDHGTPHHHTNPHQHIFEYNPDKGGWYRNEPTPYYP